MSILDIFKKKQPPLKNDNSHIKSEILRLIKNEIIMEVDDGVEVLRSYTCKIGGRPFLPDDFVWPTFTSTEDHVTRPLSFFCQLNLSEVAELDNENLLPDHGLLVFSMNVNHFVGDLILRTKEQLKYTILKIQQDLNHLTFQKN